MDYIDLHVHSTKSDGTLSPSDLTAYAKEKELRAYALTDHDNTDGLEEAFAAGKALDIEVVAGIEFSSVYQGRDIHILGLDMDWRHPHFVEETRRFQEGRLERNRTMIKRLADDGFDISWEQMHESFGDTVWTRAHFARYLADHGYVKNMWSAFDTLIGDDCKYFVPRIKVLPSEVTALIREAGGIPVLAHPYQYKLKEDELSALVASLKDSGLIGIEAIYSSHTGFQEGDMRRFARQHGLLISGGSDFHGSNKPAIDLGRGRGNLRIPYSVLEDLRTCRDRHNS